jgi:hypothetical protein
MPKEVKVAPRACITTTTGILGAINSSLTANVHSTLIISRKNKLNKAGKTIQLITEAITAAAAEHQDIWKQIDMYTQKYAAFIRRARTALDECDADHAYLTELKQQKFPAGVAVVPTPRLPTPPQLPPAPRLPTPLPTEPIVPIKPKHKHHHHHHHHHTSVHKQPK